MKRIPRYDFYKHKYGDELLIDVVRLADIKKYIKECPVHTLAYYDITLITEGKGHFSIDLQTHHVEPHDIIFTRPGEIRQWDKDSIREGLALLFEEEFLVSFFNDRNFLRNLSYFSTDRTSVKMSLDDDTYNRISKLILEIRREIDHYQTKNNHLLRALLYETLIWLDRLYSSFVQSDAKGSGSSANIHMERFAALVEQSFKHDHSIRSYANQLCITPNYLNEIVKEATGNSAKQFIVHKILIETKRLLTYTNLTIVEIAAETGYETPSYFIRQFRKQTGMTPLSYRKTTKP